MATVIDTLITKVEFETDTSGLNKGAQSLSQFTARATAIIAPIVAVFTGGAFINGIANTADEMIKFADATGVAVEELQDLEFAAQRQGGTIEGLRGSIERLNERIGEAAALGTGEGVAIFEQLGISLRRADGTIKSSTEVLVELNSAFQTLSRAEQISFANKLGIDAGTLRILQTAPRELENLIAQSREFGRITEQEARQAAAFNDELTNISTAFTRVAQQLGLATLPALTELLKVVGDIFGFIRDNVDFFELFGQSVVGVALAFGLLSASIRAAALASLKSAAAFLANPVFLIPTAIIAIGAALAALISEFVAWRNGAESVFGGFFQFVSDLIDSVVAKWQAFTNGFTSALSGIQDFFGISPTVAVSPTGGNSPTVSNRNNNVTIDKIEVIAQNGDSTEIAANVGQSLREQVRNAAQDFDSGIAR